MPTSHFRSRSRHGLVFELIDINLDCTTAGLTVQRTFFLPGGPLLVASCVAQAKNDTHIR